MKQKQKYIELLETKQSTKKRNKPERALPATIMGSWVSKYRGSPEEEKRESPKKRKTLKIDEMSYNEYYNYLQENCHLIEKKVVECLCEHNCKRQFLGTVNIDKLVSVIGFTSFEDFNDDEILKSKLKEDNYDPTFLRNHIKNKCVRI